MKPLRWRGVVTEDGKHFLADDQRLWKQYVATFAGQDVEVVLQRVRKPQSARKRGFLHAAVVPAFRLFLEDRFRDLLEAFREHYGEFTLEHAKDVLVRAVMNLPEDVERVSTAMNAMDDDQYQSFLFRVEGFLTGIECEFPEAERDPVRRLEKEHAA